MFFFNDISTLLSPLHGLTFIFKRLPQAKALVITHEIGLFEVDFRSEAEGNY
jgi:hypothetical protein